jgi:hypothetical protein
MMLFSFDDLEQGKQSIRKQKLEQYETITLHNLQELTGKLPGSDEIYFIWTLKSFNAFTFIKYVINTHGKIDALIMSTYNITKIIFETLMRLVDNGLITQLHLTLSDVSKSRFPQIYDLVNMEAGKRSQVSIHYGWNHSKVTLMKSGADHYIVEGSGNFSENSRHEQYIFMNSKEIYEFRSTWIRNDIY